MTTTVPTNQPKTTVTYPAPVIQAQGVYMMPVQPPTPRVIRPVPGILCLSVSTVILGSLLIILGIVAAIIQARHAYVVNPIWSGLFFYLTSGILGIFVYKKRDSLCVNIAFLVMAIISSVIGFQLFFYSLGNVLNESSWCGPNAGPGYNWGEHCTPIAVRIVIGIFIVLFALAAFVIIVVSCPLTIYGTFQCCYNCCSCCRNDNSHATVQYSPHTGIMMSPRNVQSVQVVGSSQAQVIPQQTSSQPLLVAPSQPFTPSAPPAYVVSSTPPQPTVVPGKQQVAPGAPYPTPGNVPSPHVNAQNAAEKPQTDYPGNADQSSTSGKIADNPQNWQKF